VAADYTFEHHLAFEPDQADQILRQVPAAPGVVSLRGEAGEPYLTRAADIRRRLRRLLAPPEALDEQGRPVLSKRLNLRDKVRSIEYTRTGSEFESALVLYCATRAAFGAEQARKRLRLYAPYFLRITLQHEHPRVYATNRLSKKSLAESFGPFPSRAAAERYCDAVLDLFKLRRCHEDLHPFPEHPGCAYGEMKMCLEPCKQACTPEQYAAEAQRVLDFFTTRGESMLTDLVVQRDAASETMDFERAATLHAQWEKVRTAANLADDLIRPVTNLRALIVQPAAPREAGLEGGFSPLSNAAQNPGFSPGQPQLPANNPDEAALFLLDHGRIAGPERLSTLGVRAVREQTAVGSSLFAQPLMLAAIPLEDTSASPQQPAPQQTPVILSEGAESHPAPQSKDLPPGPSPQNAGDLSTSNATTLSPEDRARATIATLTARTLPSPDIAERCDYLSLFRRWYYRPEKQRSGEVFLPNPDATFPIRRILNAAARTVLGPPAALPPADREAAKTLKTKILHAGREGVEREVAVLPKRSRKRKSITPMDLSSDPRE
jgi:excinuclease ABC subunit C